MLRQQWSPNGIIVASIKKLIQDNFEKIPQRKTDYQNKITKLMTI